MTHADPVLGHSVRRRRESLGLTQVELARLLGWPQVKVSRTEAGARSATLGDLLSLAKALRASLSELLEGLERELARGETPAVVRESVLPYGAVPGLQEADLTEEAILAQLECYGVTFLASKRGRPAVFKLPLEDTLVASLRFATEPRLFLALPALLLKHAEDLDWARVVSGAVMRQFQNRLGTLVSAALQLRDQAKDVDEATWRTLETVREKLEEARLDRVEYLGSEPRSTVERELAARRTPHWLAAWHVLGHVRAESLRSGL